MAIARHISINDETYELEPSKGQRVYVGTCSTAAATNPKVCTVETFPVDGNGKPYKGTEIVVKFDATNTSTSTSPQLNVNGTGAISIWYNNAVLASTKSAYAGYANRYLHYVYDGTYWVFMGHSVDNNSTYTNVALGQGYAVQNNSAASATITAALGSYALTVNGVVSVKFIYDVPANATLNINSKGAKAIYNKDAAITEGVIKAGDIATFIYNTYYRLISVDRWQDKQDVLVSGTNLKTINNESLLGSGNITIESSSPTNIEYNSSKTALVIGGGSTKYTISLVDGDMMYPSVKINDFTYSASRFPLEVNSGDILNVVVSMKTGSCTTTMGGTTVSTSTSFSIQNVSGNIEITVAAPGGDLTPIINR